MEDRLRSIFENVNEWLKFAEAKNAILVAINGTVLFAFINEFKSIVFCPYLLKISIINLYLVEFICCLFISLMVSLFSFYPLTKVKFGINHQDQANLQSESDNLIYYDHIKKYNDEEYLNAIQKLYIEKTGKNKIEMDYANQIVMNAKITSRKNSYFKVALFFVISGFITIPLTLILYIVNRKDNVSSF